MPETRELLEDATDVIVRLLRGDDPVTFENHRWTLKDARLHLRPYTHPHPEIAIAAVASPAGPRLAGRYGVGLLSIGATTAVGFDVLAHHWDVMEERAAHYGSAVDRDAWRLVGFMHLADTKEQAYADVAHGIEAWFDYFQHTAAFPQMDVGTGSSVREFIDFVNETGLGTIGTPEEAVGQIDRLVKQSNGGFGCYVPQLRAVRPPRGAAVPGPGPLHPRREVPGPGRPARAGPPQPRRRRGGHGQVPGRAGREGLTPGAGRPAPGPIAHAAAMRSATRAATAERNSTSRARVTVRTTRSSASARGRAGPSGRRPTSRTTPRL
jgi:hypothetical protein